MKPGQTLLGIVPYLSVPTLLLLPVWLSSKFICPSIKAALSYSQIDLTHSEWKKKRKKEIKLHDNTYLSPFMLKLKQNRICSYTQVHTHAHTLTPLYVWMHRNASRIGGINCKVAKVFSQMLGTWKILNKWWLLLPCVSQVWGSLLE